MIDPLKDAQADTLMMRNGTLTLDEAIARQGYDPDEHLKQIANRNKQLDADGIVLDSDPRRTNKTGALQITDKGEKSDENTNEQFDLGLDDEDESAPANKAGDA